MKKAAGFYISAVALVLSVVALVAYFVNCGTNYFAVYGQNAVVIGCFIGAALLSLVAMFMGKNIVGGVAAIAAPAAMVYGVMTYLNDRVANIAAIFTFENNAANMADLMSCLVALGAGLLAVIVAVIASFNKAVK